MDLAGGLSRKSSFPLILFVFAAALLLLFAAPAVAVATIGTGAVIVCLFHGSSPYDPLAPEKLLIFAAGFYLLVWLISAAVHSHFPNDAYAGYAALALVYPVHRACRGWRLGARHLWCATAGASVVAAIATAFGLVADGPPIGPEAVAWGRIAFVLGAVTLASMGRDQSVVARIAFLIAAVLGIMAGLICGSWGTWLALPAVVVIWLFTSVRDNSTTAQLGVVLAILAGMATVLWVHGTGVSAWHNWLSLQLLVWWHSAGSAGLIGAVLQDWAASLAAFWSHPLIGVPPAIGPADLNQYILTLRGSGLLGALALALLIGVPGRTFARAARHDQTAVQRVGRAGLLLVTSYGVMALVAPVLSIDRTLAFYLFASTALYAAERQLRVAARKVPVRRRHSLSVTIIVKNEADRIGRCLDSVYGWADEIIVLDSGSSDDTVAIVRRYTDRVEVTDWPGFGVQKQRALDRATCDWILSLDADEVATPDLRHEIDTLLQEAPRCVAYYVPRSIIFGGKRLDFGHDHAPIRLTQREDARFSTAIVHERILPPPGKVGRLETRLLHYSWRDFGHALEKSAGYAWLGARRRHARNRWGGGLPVAVVRGIWVFVQNYFLRLALLDGGAGFLFSILSMQDSFNKYAGLWELRRMDRKKGADGSSS